MWTAAATILLAGGVGVVADAARSGDAVASACSKDRARAVVNGVTYKTRVYLVQEGMGPAVTADNTRVRLSVKANLMTDGRTGAACLPRTIQRGAPRWRYAGLYQFCIA